MGKRVREITLELRIIEAVLSGPSRALELSIEAGRRNFKHFVFGSVPRQVRERVAILSYSIIFSVLCSLSL